MLHKILVPLDGSIAAETALVPAMQIGRGTGAELLLLRALEMNYMAMPMMAGGYDWSWPVADLENCRQEIAEYLAGVRRLHDCPTCHVRALEMEGDAASCIVDTAEDEACELIVMSTHGHTGVRRVLFGSVTERVLHAAPCPVLITRAKDPIRRMLITLDGSLLGESVMEPALAIAHAAGARIILMRVNEVVPLNPLDMAASWDWDMPDQEKKLLGERRQAAEAYLREVVARYGLSPGEVESIVLDGPPVERIQEFARLYNIDLLAMSTHGHTGLRRWLYGSVTAQVMRASHCSMLVVRPPHGAEGGS